MVKRIEPLFFFPVAVWDYFIDRQGQKDADKGIQHPVKDKEIRVHVGHMGNGDAQVI